jgi:ABC-type multidrug transport system permease subunit
MRFLWLSALKDLQRLRREPMSVITWIGIPVFLIVVMTLLFGRNSPRPRGLLLVADEDASVASRFLLGTFSQGTLADTITIEKTNAVEGRRRMDRGEASALLVIPKGFGDAFLRNQPAQLRLITNPSQTIMPEIIEQSLSMMTDGAFYLQALAGDQMRALAGSRGGLRDQSTIAALLAARRIGDSLGKYLNPPRIDFELRIQEQVQKQFNFAAAFFPGALILSILYISSALGADLWIERNLGVLRRIATTPAPIAGFLAGKMAAVALVSAALGIVALAFARLMLDVPAAGMPLAALWITCGGVLLYLIMQFVQLHATSDRMARLLANLVLFPCAMLGGTFFPFEAMPQNLARVGRYTPNGFVVTRLREILDGDAAPGRIALGFAILLAVCAVTYLLSLDRLRRRFLV